MILYSSCACATTVLVPRTTNTYRHCTARTVGLVSTPFCLLIMSDEHAAPEAPTPSAAHTPAMSMNELLGAIRTVVQAEVANAIGRIYAQRFL